jgi:hypothetical protein
LTGDDQADIVPMRGGNAIQRRAIMGTFRHLLLGGLGVAAGLGMTSASAASVAFNFGSHGANGGPVCSANCIIPNQAENTFTTGGVTVGAIGYGSGGAVEFVTQKPGAIDGPGETGLGESSTGTNPSDSDYEITDSTYLLIDDAAARAAGYSITSFEMQSIQSGEGGKIFGYTGPLSSINTADLTLLDTLTNPPGAVTQTFSPTGSQQYDYYVFQADTPIGGSASADIAISQEVLARSIPEPSTWAMLLLGFAGLAFAGLRSRKTSVSIV